MTKEYQAGAILAWQKLKEQQIDQLILKAKSPSCGSSQIYDGTFSGTLTEGVGVATAYFLQQKMSVLSDEDWLAQQQEITKINEVS
ncbi:hypothetical protein SDC9_141966 [bioreactor metagenome]|uniref:Uncharacterized protein n=1 Tax=bioreactor metagenome TaxID=1076179 RepID=A0A645E0C1_9ZZZZ